MIEGNDFSEPTLQIIKSVRAQFLSPDTVHPSIPPPAPALPTPTPNVRAQPSPTFVAIRNNSKAVPTSSCQMGSGKLRKMVIIANHLSPKECSVRAKFLCFVKQSSSSHVTWSSHPSLSFNGNGGVGNCRDGDLRVKQPFNQKKGSEANCLHLHPVSSMGEVY